jgi:hypothetical protein
MSIQEEITRLNNAKSAIKTAIEGKGVTVASGTKIDGMASLIDSIGGTSGGHYGDLIFAYIMLASYGSTNTKEFSGHFYPCSYNDWFSCAGSDSKLTVDERNSLLSKLSPCSDTLSTLSSGWQSSTNGILVPVNQDFIIWSNSGTPSASGLTVRGHLGCGVMNGWESTNALPTLTSDTAHRFDVNTQKIYYGYICQVTSGSSSILW